MKEKKKSTLEFPFVLTPYGKLPQQMSESITNPLFQESEEVLSSFPWGKEGISK